MSRHEHVEHAARSEEARRWDALRKNERHQAARLSADSIPVAPGVYAWFRDGQAIYVGKAANLRQRLWGSHLRSGLDLSRSAFRRNVAEFIKVATVAECRIRPTILTKKQVAKVTDWIAACEVAWMTVTTPIEANELEMALLAEWKPPLNRADS